MGEAVGGVADESSSSPIARFKARRRRANVEGGRQHRHEVKVTPEEEAQLLLLAEQQRVTVPRLLVESALAHGRETSSERRELVAELFAVHRLLAAISNNVNQIARTVNVGEPVPPQTREVLNAVRRTAQRIDTVVDGLSR